ncbi:unnamed protein product, partial [Oppiella nova]
MAPKATDITVRGFRSANSCSSIFTTLILY